MSTSDWDNEYARVARAASQLRTTGLANNHGSAAALQTGLARLETQLQSLPLAPAEITRRQRLLEHLKVNTTTTNASNNNSSQMATAMQTQDSLIDELAVGVGRLKHQTMHIGDEAKMHVNLLADMEIGLDEAQAGLDAETRRAARLRDDQSVWKLQLILAGEFLILSLLIVMGLS
jgi:hypothetical protein